LLIGSTDTGAWWQTDSSILEKEGLMLIRGGGGMFERERGDIVHLLADVLAGRGPFPTEFLPQGELIPPEILLPVAEAIFSTVSIPVSQSPIKGTTLSNLLALAGGIDLQTVHMTHLGQREVVLALLTAAGIKIVFGAADGVSYALKNGLSYYLLRWMGVPEKFAIEHARKEVRRARARQKSTGSK
jgi:hypothetical protein